MAAQKGELIFIVDGSQTGAGHTALMVSVLWKSVAIPVAWTVRAGEKGHFPEKMHLELLQSILGIVPEQCRIVVLGDGEFDGQGLLGFCASHGWEFVVRTASDRKIDCGGESASISELCPAPGETFVFAPNAIDGIHAVYWHEKRFEKPIFLLTNMELAQMACRYYKKRFKIETMFKQLKSGGFQLHKTQLKSAEKISNLIIVVATAFLLTLCLGRFLKQNTPLDELGEFIRIDKLPKMGDIILAQRCLSEHFDSALCFFSDLSKNLAWVFT